ncbi:Cysteine-rich RLK (receptor-like protein kinase) 8 [Cucumis melo var. makuwa]|uniref:Cysteine-rich RLK (Receptor-like protein kinase) 8 n=1 Tax=Cucumis melo var. makuwa TaxID=1194695 RepID=A0A5D3BT40_CUCMM|nr:Cysteine-rich RLK (receptor-like protein kinase) 8 [Cucumis melo var. makuwa]
MTSPIDSCVDSKMSENDRSNIAAPEDMGEKDSVDETEVKAESSGNEAEQDQSGNLDEYNPFLDIPIVQRKGTRFCTKHPICNYVSYESLSPQFRAFIASLYSTVIPKNIHIALECPEWKTTIIEEIRVLEKNKTREIYTLPKEHKTVGCKWVFTLKYKARLVAKRFTQTYDVDYSKTFSPVAKLNTVKVLLSIVVNKDWPLYQLNVKNVFLNEDLEEEVYMSPPLGFKAQFDHRVCKLQKSLYGLKQSPRAWIDRFTTFGKSQGYNQGHSDHTLFAKVFRGWKDCHVDCLCY